MLIIYNTLQIGGIETFYVRLAKERFRRGLKTKILLTQPKYFNNKELLDNMQKYAEVFFLEDYSFIPKRLIKFITQHFLLLHPIKIKKIKKVFEDVSSVHVSSSIYGFFYLRIASVLKLNIPLSIGVYHSMEFCWSFKKGLPFYERKNRELFFDKKYLCNRIFFNEKVAESTVGKESVPCFPLGVIENIDENLNKKIRNKQLLIGCVGRLVSFKTYNIWILGVIKELRSDGVDVKLVVYGDGPLEKEMEKIIKNLEIEDCVKLSGTLPYSEFKKVVKEFDIFIGSGTAIVEAASLGVPSIIGVEKVKEPMTYGFFSDILGFSYNEDGFYEKLSALELIRNYVNMDEIKKKDLAMRHIEKSKCFSIESCVNNFEEINLKRTNGETIEKFSKLMFRIQYCLSYFFFVLGFKIRKKNYGETVYG